MFHFIYEEYKIGHRRAAVHYARTRLFGLIPFGLVGLMASIHGLRAGPGLWCALGIAVALHMMLWSAFHLHDLREGESRAAAALVRNSDAWFPSVFVVIQNAFAGLTLFILWFTITELGFQATMTQHLLLLLTVVLFPARRLVLKTPPSERTRAQETWNEILHYSALITLTLLIALIVTSAFMPPDRPLTTQVPALLIVVWLAASLVVLSCIVLFVDHIVRKRPEMADGARRAGGVAKSQG